MKIFSQINNSGNGLLFICFSKIGFSSKLCPKDKLCAAIADFSTSKFFTCHMCSLYVFFVQISTCLSIITTFTILTFDFVNTWFINIENFLYRCSYRWQILREEFVSELAFEYQISGFTHRHLNQLDHQETYTNSETNLSLSLFRISIQDSQNRYITIRTREQPTSGYFVWIYFIY